MTQWSISEELCSERNVSRMRLESIQGPPLVAPSAASAAFQVAVVQQKQFEETLERVSDKQEEVVERQRRLPSVQKTSLILAILIRLLKLLKAKIQLRKRFQHRLKPMQS